MIRNILMDLDETILDFTKCENVAIAETFKKIGIEPTSENVKRYSAINDLHWKRLERKEITRQEVLTTSKVSKSGASSVSSTFTASLT